MADRREIYTTLGIEGKREKVVLLKDGGGENPEPRG